MNETIPLSELRKLSYAEIEALQNTRFKATAQCLLPEVPAYAQMFKEYSVDPKRLEKPEDWKTCGLPLISKKYYMKHVNEFVAQPKNPLKLFIAYTKYTEVEKTATLLLNVWNKETIAKEIKYYFNPQMPLFSGGTQSKRPTPVFITAKQKENLAAGMKATIELVQPHIPKQKTIGMNLFPYGPVLAWKAVQTAFELSAGMNLETAAGGAMRTKDLVQMADAFRPNIIAGMASYVANRFLPMASRAKVKFPDKMLYINGSERMTEKDRQKIIELFKKMKVQPTILDFFGASELKSDVMPECAPGAGFHHLMPLSNILKTVTAEKSKDKKYIDKWKFTKDEGRLAIWNIGGAGTILHGYLLGDECKIERNKCQHCELNTERITKLKRAEMI